MTAGPIQLGRYRILSELGEGATGTVYRARDTVTGDDVVIKTLSPGLGSERQARFLDEFRIVASWQHPNIVAFVGQGEDHGVLYFAAEFLKGTDLGRAIRAGITVKGGLSIIVQVLAALAYIHEKGFIHNAIKPANIFVCDNGTVKLMGFGATTVASKAGRRIPGGAEYMSPEHIRGLNTMDGRSDLFSVGCTLYEVLTGRRPFHSDSWVEIICKMLKDEPNFDLISGCEEHATLLAILRRALAKEVERRYQDARVMSEDLQQILARVPDSANWHVTPLIDPERPVS